MDTFQIRFRSYSVSFKTPSVSVFMTHVYFPDLANKNRRLNALKKYVYPFMIMSSLKQISTLFIHSAIYFGSLLFPALYYNGVWI